MNRVIIGIAGASGSGKSRLVDDIGDALDVKYAVLHLDHYYADNAHLSLAERREINYDEPAAVELKLAREHLMILAEGRRIQRPTYDFATHLRTTKRVAIEPRPLIMVDGIFALHDAMMGSYTWKVFVETPLWLCAVRRMRRDLVEREREVDEICDQLESTVYPMFNRHVLPTKENANYIILVSGDTTASVAGLVSMIKGALG
ncbi:uridine kinase [Nanoarchaeota archaeon]